MATIIDRAAEQAGMSASVMIRLLDSPTPGLIDRLFGAARRQRARHFGRRVFLHGLLYVSTYCRNRCSFCYYRNTNTQAVRYRKTSAEVLECAGMLARSGVHLIDLTAGEDPIYFNDDPRNLEPLVEMVRCVASSTGLPVMVSLGPIPGDVMDRMHAAGAEWFACYQDTYNRELFAQLRIGQDFDRRYDTKRVAKAKGLLIEEGIMCGIGETSRDLLSGFAAMSRLGADQVRAMTFVPQEGTPRQDDPPASFLRELITIALLRITFPQLLIPASLDTGGLTGLKQRLDAGANVVDALVPPGKGLTGMISNVLDIEAGRRTVAGVAGSLRACGLEPATASEYHQWMTHRKAVWAGGGNQQAGYESCGCES